MYCRCEGDVSEAVQSDSAAETWPLTTDNVDDFNSFHFWRIQPEVVDDKSVISACGDTLASLVISSSTDNWSSTHSVGDSAQLLHPHGLPDSNHNVKESTYFKTHFMFLIYSTSVLSQCRLDNRKSMSTDVLLYIICCLHHFCAVEPQCSVTCINCTLEALLLSYLAEAKARTQAFCLSVTLFIYKKGCRCRLPA